MSDIILKDLSFGYDNNNLILKSLNLEYNAKDFLCIIGPNGAGKSTILKLILGLLKPLSGQILIFGKSPSKISKCIGYVPQYIPINKSFPISVLEVVLMGKLDRKIFGFYNKADKQDALEALKLVSMQDFAQKNISSLSGGQRQKVYIARALCAKSNILLLDEPTASIDTEGQIQIYTLLKELNTRGIGIIIISHDLNIAMNFANKIANMTNGSIFMHNIDLSKKDDDFLKHLTHHHDHFCEIELALKECECKNY